MNRERAAVCSTETSEQHEESKLVSCLHRDADPAAGSPGGAEEAMNRKRAAVCSTETSEQHEESKLVSCLHRGCRASSGLSRGR